MCLFVFLLVQSVCFRLIRGGDDLPNYLLIQKKPECEPKPQQAQLFPDVCPNATSPAFDEIYSKAVWGKVQRIEDFYSNAAWPPNERNAGSGIGSNLGYATQTSLNILRDVIVKYDVKSMIDIPCGDTNWIFDSRETDSLETYIGLDIVKAVVDLNAQRLSHHSNKMFRHWDGTSCPLPMLKNPDSKWPQPVDLIHSRDVLQHLPLHQGLQFLCNVVSSGARVFVTTTYSHDSENSEISEGDFFHNDLTKAPFDMPSQASCEPTHPQLEPDLTCVYNLTESWVADWIRRKKCRT